MTSDEVLYLRLIAAKAEQLARDLERGALWDGELREGLNEIRSTLAKVKP